MTAAPSQGVSCVSRKGLCRGNPQMSLRLTGHTHAHVENTVQTSEGSGPLTDVHRQSGTHDAGTGFKTVTVQESDGLFDILSTKELLFVFYCCLTNDPPHLVIEYKHIYYLPF